MTDWRETALAFSAEPELGALLLAAQPAIVFARDGSRVLWANPAGGRALGAADFPALATRDLDALARAVAGVGRTLPEGGTLARLRLSNAPTALPLLCRCRAVRAGSARGILVLAPGEGGRSAPAELANFFTGSDAVAVLFDADDGVVAEGAAGVAKIVTAATPSARFAEGLRLAIVPRQPEPVAPRVRRAAPPTFDGPALSLLAAALREEAARLEEAPPPVPPPVPERPPHDIAEERPAALPAPPPAAPEPPKVQPPKPEPPRIEVVRPKAPPREEPAEKPAARSVSAGRVNQPLSRKPVRFLWQTDAADRLLFISPGLAQVVGRNADIVGERWQQASARLNLDPTGRIARALRQRDTWSGLTAWWPVEGSNVRVPVELTALPVFGGDQSFQGYRGFAVLRPAEALMPAAFEARFGPPTPLGEPQPPEEESPTANVVPIRADLERMADSAHLTTQERNAFEEIAASLRERIVDGFLDRDVAETPDEEAPPPVPIPSPPVAEDVVPPPEIVPLFPDQPPLAATPPAATPPAAKPAEPRASTDAAPERSEHAQTDARLAALNEELADARNRLREMTAILDTATDGVVVLDASGVIENVNASAEALFGLDAHEMVGRRFDALLTPASRQSALDYLSGLRDSGVASILNEGREVAAEAGAGSIPLFMTMGRISSEESQRFCAVLRDITHWKRIESDLVAARRAAEDASTQKSEFLARVSNEIRAPLNSIIGNAEAMIEERYGSVDNERYREYLREIRASGEHVVNLVNDLLDIARVEAGKLALDFAAAPLNEIVREGIAQVNAQASRARVVLRSSLSREVPAIVADERTLRQIVLNLLLHSIRQAGPGGQVIVSTSLSEGGEALLRVRDTGRGMSEAEVARALEPFRDLSIASLADRAGTGLGLPLTKALVEANRAALSIRSADGEGTVLTVTIPPTRVLSE